MPASVEIVEVGPRDGLQSDAITLPTEAKVELIGRLAATGLSRIETASFVSPTKVPQMADADELMRSLDPDRKFSAIGLVLNERGLDRALAAGVDEINVIVAGSDTFGQRNQGAGVDATLDLWRAVAKKAHAHRLRTSVTVSIAFGCPFEGEMPIDRLAGIVSAVAAEAPSEIALADTIGVAVPAQVTRFVRVARDAANDVALRCHFHNTRNTGFANAWAAIEEGVYTLDASVGGIGGCPFAPRATGNIATEDLVYMLERSGVGTGVDLDALVDVVGWLEQLLGRTTPGMLRKAGRFPR